jgi:hypothetical protein
MKHLDSEYRGRHEEFFLEDGSVEDSRVKNWRDVEWDKVVRILVHVKDGRAHEFLSKNKPGFKGFMNFRWGGAIAQYNEEKEFIGMKDVKVWTVGWTDGEKHYLKDIDFHSGDIIKEYEAPFEEFKNHVHPLIIV